MNEELSYSKHGLELTEQFEGLRLTAYKDQGNVLTIGYGHTGSDVTEGRTITQQEAEFLLAVDIKVAERAVHKLVTVKLDQDTFDAVTDFVFNLGTGNFKNSTLLKHLNANEFGSATSEFMKWDKVAGKENTGLARRRLAESELFEHGIVDKQASLA